MVTESSDFLWFGLSCKSNMGLRCCNYGVPSTLKGFSTVIGLELGLLAWLSFLDSFWSLPSDLDQILHSLSLSLRTGSLGSIKARSPSTSTNQAKQTHTTCNAILTWTGLRVGSKSLHCRVGLLFYCFP